MLKYKLKYKKVGVLPISGNWGLTFRAKAVRQRETISLIKTSYLFTPLFMFIHLPLIHFAPPPRLLIDFKNSKWLTFFCILLCIIMHLLFFFLSHDHFSVLSSLGFFYLFSVSLWRRANARNVRLYHPYWLYTDLFIFWLRYIETPDCFFVVVKYWLFCFSHFYSQKLCKKGFTNRWRFGQCTLTWKKV